MSNAVLELIHAHGSARSYKPEPVPDELVEIIVAAAQRTSSSSNMQTYSVVAVRDSDKRAELARLCGEQKHIAEAPLFLAWCADLARLDRVCELTGYEQEAGYVENFLVAAVDAAIAAQTAALAAESLGLGICYIGSIRNQPLAVAELLGLPQHVFPVTGMTVGWPSKPARLRPRLPLGNILHLEQYHPEPEEGLLAYDREMAATGIYEKRQVPLPGKPGEIKDYGWLEHTARRASQPVRVALRAALEKQGFPLK
jgi:FMN reductase (NADPH)